MVWRFGSLARFLSNLWGLAGSALANHEKMQETKQGTSQLTPSFIQSMCGDLQAYIAAEVPPVQRGRVSALLASMQKWAIMPFGGGKRVGGLDGRGFFKGAATEPRRTFVIDLVTHSTLHTFCACVGPLQLSSWRCGCASGAQLSRWRMMTCW